MLHGVHGKGAQIRLCVLIDWLTTIKADCIALHLNQTTLVTANLSSSDFRLLGTQTSRIK